jgi:hypothetical protein
MAVLGPDTPARAPEDRTSPVHATQSQVAATLATFLGQDYGAFAPQAGPPIDRVLPQAAPRR